MPSPVVGVRWWRVAAGLVVLGVLLQVAYPLLEGAALRTVTLGSVVVLALASLAHALASRGGRYAAVLLVTAAGGGFVAEAVGTATGVPFGEYAYADSLGPRLLDVPLLVPLAWLMLAHPCALAGRRLAGPRWGVAVGAWLLASWDLFLDPQMVAAGHWTWVDPTPALPGVPGIPVGNYLGWLLVAGLMMLVLVPRGGPPQGMPRDAPAAAVLLWTYASQVLANLAFFGRPAVAAWGGVLMGLAALPYAVAVRRDGRG